MIYIFWTCRDKKEAKKIVFELIEQHLIACASLLPEIESIYRWEGKIEEQKEVKVILKTQKKHFDKIANYIVHHSSYQVPEIVQISPDKGYEPYISWIIAQTSVEG